MANLTRDLVVNILADTSKMNQGIDQANAKMSKFGQAAKIAGGAVVAGVAADAVIGFLGDSVKAAQEHNKIMAQTEAVITSMGNAAGVTAEEVDDLATSIEAKTAVDADAIIEGQNLLLTFGNIKNAAGEGNDIFDQTTKLMVDMAAAMGTDASSGAIQLGKALNDPVTGITALTRVGVSFTEQQKEQIKAMAEAGDVAGAQKLILAELEKQFGGSAEAQATSVDLMNVKWKQLQEEIGMRLLPVIEGLSKFFLEDLIPAVEAVWPVVQRVFDLVSSHAQAAMHLVMVVVEPIIHLLKGEWGEAWESFKEHAVGIFKPITEAVSQGITGIKFLFSGLVSFIAELPGKIVNAASGMWDGIWTAFKAAVNKIIDAWNSLEFKIPGFKVGPVGFDGFTLGVPDIPHLAEGGFITRSGLAVVHAGERVVSAAKVGTDHGGPGLTVQVIAFNPDMVVSALNDYARRNGGLRVVGGVTAVS